MFHIRSFEHFLKRGIRCRSQCGSHISQTIKPAQTVPIE